MAAVDQTWPSPETSPESKKLSSTPNCSASLCSLGVMAAPYIAHLRIAVAHRLPILLQVAEDLIVGAVLFDDVDHVLDALAVAISAAGKRDLFLRGLHAIRGKHSLGPAGQVGVNLALV